MLHVYQLLIILTVFRGGFPNKVSICMKKKYEKDIAGPFRVVSLFWRLGDSVPFVGDLVGSVLVCNRCEE